MRTSRTPWVGRAEHVRKPLRGALFTALLASSICACRDGDESSPRALPSIETRPASATELPRGEGPDVGTAFQPAVGATGPGDRGFSVTSRTRGGPTAAHRTIGVRTFEVALRPAPLRQYPCTSCHVGAQVMAARIQDTHQDIQVTHPSAARGGCSVCHARNDVARLILQGGDTGSFDEAYRLCGQCHSPQTEAWAGGAHGKRLVGWRGERVVMACAECHDPHAPATPRRMPFRGPVLP